MAENSEVDIEEIEAAAQQCDRGELLGKLLEAWDEFIESCELIVGQIGPSHADQAGYTAEVARSRDLIAALGDAEHAGEAVDGIMGDLDLAGRNLSDFNSSFEPAEADDAVGAGHAEGIPGAIADEVAEAGDVKVFCQARIEWKKARTWRSRLAVCLGESSTAEEKPEPTPEPDEAELPE